MNNNMTNRLAAIQKYNVNALMKTHNLTNKDMTAKTGISASTMSNCFGKNANTAASDKTMDKIYAHFTELPQGSLDVADGIDDLPSITPDPQKSSELPVVIPDEILVEMRVGKTNIQSHVPRDIAVAILAMLIPDLKKAL